MGLATISANPEFPGLVFSTPGEQLKYMQPWLFVSWNYALVNWDDTEISIELIQH